MRVHAEMREMETLGIEREVEFSMEMGPHMMLLWSNLYSDRHLAVVREYLTNMLDAYVKLEEAAPGTEAPDPIVHLPNRLEPYLEFKDFGIGMSRETVEEVFTKYGKSTKNDNDDEVGGFGVGAKVGFAYADQWTVESRFHGRKYAYAMSKNARGIPTALFLGQTDTTEKDGVTVRLPVSAVDFYIFWDRLARLAPYFPRPLKVIGGEAPFEVKPPSYTMQGKTWGVHVGRSVGNHVVVGNIPYPLNESILLSRTNATATLLSDISLDLYVPVGSVDITPSRESLEYSDRTVETLQAAVRTFREELRKEANRRIQDAKSLWEAHCQASEITKIPALRDAVRDLSWHGVPVDVHGGLRIKVADLLERIPGLGVEQYANSDGRASFRRDVLSAVSSSSLSFYPKGKTWVFVNDEEKISVAMAKVHTFLRMNLEKTNSRGEPTYAMGVAYLLTVPGGREDELVSLLDGFPIAGPVSALPLPPRRASAKRSSVSVKRLNQYDNWEDVDVDVEEGGYYVRLSGGSVERVYGPHGVMEVRDAAVQLGLLPEGTEVYGIPRTRKNLEDKPGWTNLFDAIRPKVERLLRTEARTWARAEAWKRAVRGALPEWLLSLSAEEIPRQSLLYQVHKEMHTTQPDRERSRALRTLANVFCLSLPTAAGDASRLEKKLDQARTRYPLLVAMEKVNSSYYHYGPWEKMKGELLDYVRLVERDRRKARREDTGRHPVQLVA